MDSKVIILITIVYAIIETLEKFGLSKKYAHVLALPLGIISSFLLLELASSIDYVLYGIFIGLISVGTCDTFCNIVDIIKPKKKK